MLQDVRRDSAIPQFDNVHLNDAMVPCLPRMLNCCTRNSRVLELLVSEGSGLIEFAEMRCFSPLTRLEGLIRWAYSGCSLAAPFLYPGGYMARNVGSQGRAEDRGCHRG